jgi:DNA-binding transcriptional regulator YdaS (Cro superfamily)
MKASDFRAALDELAIPQRQFAQRAGVTPEAVNRWCSGKNAVPQWAAWIVTLLRAPTAERATEDRGV